MTLGAHDPFRDVASWDPATAAEWTEALDRRAAGADQAALRRALVAAARLGPDDLAIDVGCGTGALLRDLRDVAGRAVGVEPQPAFARLAGAVVGVGEHLPVASGVAAAAVAQTVLVHLPAPVLAATLAEMVRVTRPGGRVLSADQDGDTWIIDHPDRETTRRIVRFNSDQRYADGWTGRRLPRLFRAAGLTDVEVTALPHVDTGEDTYLRGMALRLAAAAGDAGVLSREEVDRWIDVLPTTEFFSTITYFLCVGTVGSS